MRKTKLKINRSLSVDMAALCDVAFLILVFCIATSKFKAWEPMKIDTPSGATSIVCSLGDDSATGIIYITGDRVMYQIAGDSMVRKATLGQMGQMYNIKFSRDDSEAFMGAPIIGAPIAQLKQYDRQYQDWGTNISRPGIPYDMGSNELFNWVRESRKAEKAIHDRALLIDIKADKNVSYPVIKQVIAMLQGQNVNKFSLIVDGKGRY
ncbi:hypothetical protein BEL04_22115 [Mucilaginibacter sp. PPCGB 2223]|uniref:biopolymer transporter ExbD n=1 Tax=Mucilaginibacter sp. PPCGB 2223 TaxID=1886027 RepID=UPI000825E594|nr:biopolymer transporter ExbD [Mucilaginibacter sp. PPCGB 2223]OCX50480.1 hypothetical protein BEL04_22115 [Mucilaginibacter sp. PPCGB 2223]